MTISIHPNASFQSDLANVIFGAAPDPVREPDERAAVTQFAKLLESATSTQIFKQGPYIDAMLVPRLSGRNLLHVAKLIEARAPAAIENMPRLRKLREHLRKSAELAKILSPAALNQMIQALSAEPKQGA
jgi:hypothetical protein